MEPPDTIIGIILDVHILLAFLVFGAPLVLSTRAEVSKDSEKDAQSCLQDKELDDNKEAIWRRRQKIASSRARLQRLKYLREERTQKEREDRELQEEHEVNELQRQQSLSELDPFYETPPYQYPEIIYLPSPQNYCFGDLSTSALLPGDEQLGEYDFDAFLSGDGDTDWDLEFPGASLVNHGSMQVKGIVQEAEDGAEMMWGAKGGK